MIYCLKENWSFSSDEGTWLNISGECIRLNQVNIGNLKQRTGLLR